MDHNKIKTLGALKKSDYKYKSIKDELRTNLINMLKEKKTPFSGIIGYDATVIPQLQRAILAKHNINLLGLRGQAKTRIARSLVNLLDEWMPVVAGSEINDDPLKPISKYAIDKIAAEGDKTPVEWIHRDKRFFEKLATPDVTVADLIGDVDPIKAATLKLTYADERVIHYGMIPRANRSIFVINELPDLQARIQVALFNILQEGDVQIRGFQIRMELDLQFVFTANPEDYTNRGSIVTPLKDRIGSQILTHYPITRDISKEITAQEAKVDKLLAGNIHVPELAKDILEQISFEARKSEFIDAKSGISARMTITAYENLLSTAELRLLKSGDQKTGIRMSDLLGIIPAITGKVELVYEGEQEGAEGVANLLIGNAIKSLFDENFVEIKKLSKPGQYDDFDQLTEWFINNPGFELENEVNEKTFEKAINQIKPLDNILEKYQPELAKKDRLFAKEFVLWALVEYKKLAKKRFAEGYEFEDNILRGY
ncbi:sigma 54-interacting transcriptional regulator [Crocinitomix catalasitica]|uniref:sigma 54-interacting transcriptional regulator n=1 Tax=Crocinitomix catalasitica TaxID=184607 RepID=UPI0004874A02|nr:sigma 54-interacting transcriptional regulator [Crocinitomix catalasitica]